MPVKERGIVELLPAQRDIRVRRLRSQLSEALLARHDAALILCRQIDQAQALAGLPQGAQWQALYTTQRRNGPVSILTTRATGGQPLVLVLAPEQATAFQRLTLAARAWKALAPPPGARVLLAASTDPALPATAEAAMLEALAAAALAGGAPMPVFKTSPQPEQAPPRLQLLCQSPPDLNVTTAAHRGNHLARWLTALPPNMLDSAGYRRAIRELARREGWDFTFMDEKVLRRLRAGAFLAVTQANEHRDAGIVRLRYRAAGRARQRKRLSLVGKGICFDTGGINLKPHKSMYQMHQDMQGSAVALGTLLALSRLRVPYDIDCWLAITENEGGARAFRPQQIITASNGLSIQMVHSDAEGRLVLADTLALAAREQPDLLLDYATLTGACVMALTERYSGAFTNRPDWHPALIAAGRDSGERVWPFPMDEDFDSDLEAPAADLLQCALDSKGDHILAARFLNHFVPRQTPWVHLDLAASNRSGGLAHVPTDVTGFGVRYTLELLLGQDLLQLQQSSSASRR